MKISEEKKKVFEKKLKIHELDEKMLVHLLVPLVQSFCFSADSPGPYSIEDETELFCELMEEEVETPRDFCPVVLFVGELEKVE